MVSENSSRRRLFRLMAGAGMIGIVIGIWNWTRYQSPEQLLAAGRTALASEQFSEAEKLALRVLSTLPESPAALLLAGQAANGQRRPADAVVYLDRVPSGHGETAVKARFLTAELLFHQLSRLSEAEQRLRELLEDEPGHAPANRLLVSLLDMCGRSWEAIPVRLELIRLNTSNPSDLIAMIDREPRIDLEALRDCARRSPDDPLTKLAVAGAELPSSSPSQVEALLQEVTTAAPDVREAQARLGQLLWSSSRIQEFQAWAANLPAATREHPEIWALRGDLASQHRDLRGAARAYWESLRCDACYRRSAYQLGQVLLALGDSERAAPFVERAALLQQLTSVLERYAAAPDASTVEKLAALCESLGLLWEAQAWSEFALETNPQLAWAQSFLERLRPRLSPELPRTAPELDPAQTIDLTDFPLPRWDTAGAIPPSSVETSDEQNVRFVDEAASANFNVRYFNDEDHETPAARPFEFTGGGVAVLDYDGDGWPDVYLTQGCVWPEQPDRQDQLDRLFRNLGDGRFCDVTEDVGLIENSYSQGVTVGDYNSDGHPDLYVANLDANRLFRNNGDGTFTDVTIESGTGGDRWTTSCLMADLNGDAWPDIYAVNYLTGSDVFERICRTSQGTPRICTPNDFEPAQDQMYLNLGDGRFEEWTEEGGILTTYGKGLGIVAVDLTESGRLDLFVANDTDSNGLFVNTTPAAGETPRFREEAIGSGLAFDQNGRPQACMGVAVGDANGDALIDLFVTNYYQESNTLYLQQPGNLFRDATHEAGLRESSLPMLGFGTQFLDAERDGFPDLICANGHVEDQRDRGVPYEMRPQFFRNLGAGRFVELSAKSLGPYFQQELLGRGMARLDWNRDGLEDVVISHLDAPAALLTNRTSKAGHFIALQLRGTTCSRDAIGTTVTLKVGDRNWVQQLTAGDGYQASNERQLIFGLGTLEQINELVIRWPSGVHQQYSKPQIDSTVIAVEGRESLLRVSGE